MLYHLQCWDEALDCYLEVSRLQHDNLTARLAAAYCLDRLGKFIIYNYVLYHACYFETRKGIRWSEVGLAIALAGRAFTRRKMAEFRWRSSGDTILS